MKKTILITGSTDGIGLAAAVKLADAGHAVALHGRNGTKLAAATALVADASATKIDIEVFEADLSRLANVVELATSVTERIGSLDVLMNNAGVFMTPNPVTSDGLDVRFVVNTIAPYLLAQRLLPTLAADGRLVNLSSAAQAPVNARALLGEIQLGDSDAYAQSKLALTMWSRHMAQALARDGPSVFAVNPGSLLATKMVKEGYGFDGHDINIGADILVRSAVSDDFADASGRYFDNDAGVFHDPHPDALSSDKNEAIVRLIESIIDSHV